MRATPLLAIVLSFVGCATPPKSGDSILVPPATASASASAATPTRREPPADPLDGHAGDRTALRAWITSNDGVTFVAGGAPVAKSPNTLAHPIEGIVVEQVGADMRLVLEGKEVRLVVLAPPRCTAMVIERPTRLARTASAPVGEDGIRLAPGVIVTEKETQGTWHHVEGVADSMKFSGWVEEEALDRAFAHGPFPRLDATAVVREGASLFDDEGGVFARLPIFGERPSPDPDLPAQVLPGERPSFVHVLYRSASIEVRGWVHTSDHRLLEKDEIPSIHGSGWGDGGGMSGHEIVKLSAGTLLHDDDGRHVGTVKQEDTRFYLQAKLSPDSDAPLPGYIHATGLGFVTVYVHPQDLRPR